MRRTDELIRAAAETKQLKPLALGFDYWGFNDVFLRAVLDSGRRFIAQKHHSRVRSSLMPCDCCCACFYVFCSRCVVAIPELSRNNSTTDCNNHPSSGLLQHRIRRSTCAVHVSKHASRDHRGPPAISAHMFRYL